MAGKSKRPAAGDELARARAKLKLVKKVLASLEDRLESIESRGDARSCFNVLQRFGETLDDAEPELPW